MVQPAEPMLDRSLHEHLDDREFGTLSNWCENAGCSITLIRWLAGGGTSAKLAVVLIDDGHYERKGVLKYCPSKNAQPRDFQAFNVASESGPPGFAKKHLVSLDSAAQKPIPNGSDGLFLLMSWNVGGRDKYDTMAALLDREVLGTACETVVKSTLLDWNNVKRKVSGARADTSATEFLYEILGGRCEPGETIHVAAQGLGASFTEAYISGPEKLLPNPLAAATTSMWVAGKNVFGFRGNAHGDLHADNILVPQPHEGRPSVAHFRRYILIDLSTFSNRRLVAADPAFLLMSIIARRLGDISATGKVRLARLVLEPEYEESGGIPGEITLAARGIQRAGIAFAKRGSLYDEWQAESILAIAGCALLFVGWSHSDDDRLWFLQLAGMAIDAFVYSHGRRDVPLVRNDTRPQDALPQPRPAENTGGADQTPVSPSTCPMPGRKPENSDSRKSPQGGAPPSRGTTPDGPALAPVPDAVAPALNVSENVLSATPVVIEQGVAVCTALADELASEIEEFADNVPPKAASAQLFTARDIVDDLSEAARNMLAWLEQGSSDHHISYITAIEAVRVQIAKVTGALHQMSEHGINPNSQGDAAAAIERLQHAIGEIDPRPRP